MLDLIAQIKGIWESDRKRVLDVSSQIVENLKREPLFHNEREAQGQWPSAHHGEVVHRPADREPADVAARELQGLDDVCVGREADVPCHLRQDGAVRERIKQLVPELRQDALREEPSCHLPAAAVGYDDPLFTHAVRLPCRPG